MKNQSINEKVASAFWHAPRRTFIPCTAMDVARRSGVSAARCNNIMQSMVRGGMLTSMNNSNFHTYDLTAKGRNYVSEVTA